MNFWFCRFPKATVFEPDRFSKVLGVTLAIRDRGFRSDTREDFLMNSIEPWEVRARIYDRLIATGRVPLVAELVQMTGSSSEATAAALQTLHEQHHVVVGDDGEVAVAHPFSSVPTGFLVTYGAVSAWGFCIWDALGIAAMTSENASIDTSCSKCFKRIRLEIRDSSLVTGCQYVAQFIVPPPHMWDDVRLTCSMQLAFCHELHAQEWRRTFGRGPGSLLPMQKTWQLAERWYGEDRRLRSWRRRTAEEANAIFSELALPRAFWSVDHST